MSVETETRLRPTKARRNNRRLIAGLALTAAALPLLTVLDSEDVKDDRRIPVGLVDLIQVGIDGAILIGDTACPDGDRSLLENEDVVQDYQIGVGNKLIAIDPQEVYLAGSTILAFCGPDYGKHGESFDGNAVIIVGQLTLIGEPRQT